MRVLIEAVGAARHCMLCAYIASRGRLHCPQQPSSPQLSPDFLGQTTSAACRVATEHCPAFCAGGRVPQQCWG